MLTAYAWQNLASANPTWAAAASWSPSSAFPNSSADSANLSADLTTTQSIALAQNITVQSALFGDTALTGGVGQTQTISAGNILTFDNGSSSASLTLASGTVAGATIAAPISLDSNLVVTDNDDIANPLTLSGNIDTKGHSLTVAGTGKVIISGAVSNSAASGAVTATLSKSTSTAITFGQSVTFTATLSSSVETPAGSVLFMDGSTVLGTAALSGGVATLATASLGAAVHSLSAIYGGSPDLAAATSNALTQTINKSSTTTALTKNATGAIRFGQSVSFTATMAAVSPGIGTPWGSVTFKDGSTAIGTATLGGGVATFTTTSLATGSHPSITAVYGGDSNFNTSTSSAATQTVNQSSTTTTLTKSTTAPIIYGQSVTFTATMAAVSPGAGTPTGTITFMDGSTTLATATLSSGAATFTSSSLAAASHPVTAVYSGDTNFSTSTSSAVTQTVNPSSTAESLAKSTTGVISYGQSVTFTATLSAVSPGVGTPTGTVTFMDGSTALATATLSGGVATFTTTTLPAGSHTALTAVYAGDGNFNSKTSNTLTQTVNHSSTTTALSSSAAGANITFTATLSPVAPGAGTPAGSVTFKNGSTTIGTATLAAGVASFSTTALPVGTDSITAVYAGDANYNTSTSSAVNVTVSLTLTSIAVTPATPTINENQATQFSASGLDQFGTALTTQPTFTWSATGAGSINSTGLYTAPTSVGSTTITATSGSVTGSASATVAEGPPTVATASTAMLSTDGTYATLNVLGADANGESGLTYAWTTTSAPSGAPAPTFTDAGTNTAKDALAFFQVAGNYTFQATITNVAGLAVTSSVSLTVTQIATSIDVTPAGPVLVAGMSEPFVAVEADQFGNAMTTQPTTFTWSVESDGEGGTITATGDYTAGGAGGLDMIDVADSADSLTGQAYASDVTTAPDAPTGVTATPAEQGVVLTWDSGVDAGSYDVYRGTTAGGESATPVASGLSDPTFTDTGLTDGATYYYTLQAINPLGMSSASAEANAAPGRVGPGEVWATPGDHAIDISWDSALGASSYNLYRSTTTGGEGTTPYQTGLTEAGYTDAQTTSTPYYYTVTATYPSGEGVASAESSAAAELAVPSNPSNLVAAVNGSNEVDLSWTAASGADQYIIEMSTDGTTFSPYDQVDGSTTTYADTGAADGTAYTYEVLASNAVGDSAAAMSSAVTTPIAAPDQLTADTISSTEIDLTWENNSSGATGFTVQRSTDGVHFTTIGTTDSDTTTYDDEGLSPGTGYTYQVVATTSSATSAASSSTSATTTPASLAGLAASADSASQITLTWTPVTGATGYEIDRKDPVNTTFEAIDSVDQPSGASASYSDTGLSDGTAYTYQVIPYNDSGEADGTNPSASAATPLIAPSNVAAVALSSGSVEVVWQNESSSETTFNVQRLLDGAPDGESIPVDSGTTDYVDSNAQPSTTYTYEVSASNSTGDSAATGASEVTTPSAPATSAPVMPILISAAAASTSSIQISYSASDGSHLELEQTGPGDPNFHKIADLGSSTASSAQSYVVSGLASDMNYSFRLRADKGGEMIYSAVKSASTSSGQFLTGDPGGPAAPTGLTISDLQPSSFSVSDSNGDLLILTLSSPEYPGLDSNWWWGYGNDVLSVNPNTTYTIWAQAMDPSTLALSAPSLVTVTTPGTLPSAPTGITVVPGSGTDTADVSWSYDLDTPNMVGFMVYEADADGTRSAETFVDSSTTSAELYGQAGATYVVTAMTTAPDEDGGYLEESKFSAAATLSGGARSRRTASRPPRLPAASGCSGTTLRLMKPGLPSSAAPAPTFQPICRPSPSLLT